MNESRKDYKLGVLLAIGCQIAWGFLPIYWQSLKPIDSAIIVLYRIVTMFVFSLIGARMKYSFKEIFGPLKDKKLLFRTFIAGLILTANWSIYIWSINSGRVIQAAIGYYIEPIVICVFGIVLFKEKVTKYNGTAMGFALLAVVVILLHFGQLPSVALGLAITWAVYSVVKKTSKQPTIIALVHETLPFAIMATIAIIYIESKGIGALSMEMPGKYSLMLLSGLATVIPVALFGMAATKVPLYVLGLAQYINPTITLVCGIFLFNEELDLVQVGAFVLIWIGLIFFTIGELVNARKQMQIQGSDLQETNS